MGTLRPRLIFATGLLLSASHTFAGMRPAPQLTDIARFRLSTISFFVVAIFVCALVTMLAWNYLRRDFTRLPRLNYLRSLLLVSLWGVLFMIVLGMISGARELMTPGAWERREDGGYRVSDPYSSAPDLARRRRLEDLQVELWGYAKAHDGSFPPHDFVPEIPDRAWQVLHPTAVHFRYVPGRKAGEGEEIVAYEPEVYGAERFVLLSNGRVERRSIEQINESLKIPRP
jgi:hypothetical protein